MSNDKSPRCFRDEPGDHALGRSRGGLSTKIHAAVDGRGRPLAILLTPGQAGDAPMMLPLLAHLRVQRTIGRPGTRPGTSLCVSTPTTRPSATVTCTPSSSATSRSVSAGRDTHGARSGNAPIGSHGDTATGAGMDRQIRWAMRLDR